MKTKKTPCGHLVVLALVLAPALPALAQQSTNYKLNEHVLNAGGHPDNGAALTSTSFTISLDSIGDGIVARALSSPSFRMDAGFTNTYRPPSEVQGLLFDDAQSLRWDADPSAGMYNLYRATLGTLNMLTYGSCEQQALVQPSTVDTDPIAPGGGFFYLVTVENRLREEGTRGYRSNSAERIGPVCP